MSENIKTPLYTDEDYDRYQLLPPLAAEEYEALKADIADRGVLIPIILDEEGNVLDGHHRLRACQELGITGYPIEIKRGLTDSEKIDMAVITNMARRHLNSKDKEKVICRMLRDRPEASDRSIGRLLGVDNKTVAKNRYRLEETGEIPRMDRTEGADGIVRRKATSAQKAQAAARKARRSPAPAQEEPDFELLRAAIQEIPEIEDEALRQECRVTQSEINAYRTAVEQERAEREIELQRQKEEAEAARLAEQQFQEKANKTLRERLEANVARARNLNAKMTMDGEMALVEIRAANEEFLFNVAAYTDTYPQLKVDPVARSHVAELLMHTMDQVQEVIQTFMVET